MARKTDTELRAAVQALAPIKPIEKEPEQSPEERKARRARIDRILATTRQRMVSHPRPHPLEHWRRVLANPYACYIAKEMAQEAIAEIEKKAETVERIAIDAEIQETARRIAQQLGEKEEHERAGATSPT